MGVQTLRVNGGTGLQTRPQPAPGQGDLPRGSGLGGGGVVRPGAG